MTSTNSSTQGPFYLVVLQLIIAWKLSELEQFENQATNYRIASRKGENEKKIKLRLFQSFRKCVVCQGDVDLAVKLNFKGGIFFKFCPMAHPFATKMEFQWFFLQKRKLNENSPFWAEGCILVQKIMETLLKIKFYR